MLLGLQQNLLQEHGLPSGAIVTFDPVNYRIIELDTGGDNELDWIEIYSEWKVWAALGDNLKYLPAFGVVGGQAISDIQNLGSTFFLNFPWKLRPAERDHRLLLKGNVFTVPAGTSAVTETLGGYTVLVESFVSNLVDASVARLDLSQLQEAVFIDTVEGDDANTGTPTAPVQTISRAFEVANANSLHAFSLIGSITLDRTVTNWRFHGTIGAGAGTVSFGGFQAATSSFDHLTLTGDANASRLEATSCLLVSLTNVSGDFDRCALSQLFTPSNASNTSLTFCTSNIAGLGVPVIDLGDLVADNLQVRAFSGGLELRNVDVAGQKVSIDMISGHLVLDSTCDAGEVVIRGVGKLTDNSTGTLVIDKVGFIDGNTYPADIGSAVWDALSIDHRDAASIGELMWKIFLSKFDAPT